MWCQRREEVRYPFFAARWFLPRRPRWTAEPWRRMGASEGDRQQAPVSLSMTDHPPRVQLLPPPHASKEPAR